MPVNRNALVRYRTIDNCLRNRFRKWTLEDLIDACSEALYEYEGIDKGVSRRTIQMDLQMMRSDKLGYNAPIIVLDKKFYTYEDADYSITNIPLTDEDLRKLTEVTEILRQFKGFTHFQDISGMVNRLEDKIHTAKTHQEPIIDFEKNENLKGLEHIDVIYRAIQQKLCLKLCYQSFKAREPQEFVFHPYLLKEFRNRWFVLGKRNKGKVTLLLALDRIHDIEVLKTHPYYPADIDVHNYFKNVIGVTVNEGNKPERVTLFVARSNAPYVITKPLHPSQQVLETTNHGIVITIDVQLNFELEREILGFGPNMKVLSPDHFKRRIKNNLRDGLDNYETEITNSRLGNARHRIKKRGYDILDSVYSKKEVNQMKNLVGKYIRETKGTEAVKETLALRQLLLKVPELRQIILNQNLKQILDSIFPNATLTKAIYFNKPHLSNWYVTWHQDITINVKERVEATGYSGWTHKEGFYAVCPPINLLQNTLAVRVHLDESNSTNGTLQVIPGSHTQKLGDSEIQMITQNSSPTICDIGSGGVQLMKPLLLHSSSKSRSPKPRRVIHLEFCCGELAEGLEWSEG